MSELQYFLGANSPSGFYSLYDELLPIQQARQIYILKGGPGCGKSTLMRQVARQVQEAGWQTVSVLCSGDPDSLDALILPQKGIALVDGTAPHVVEPQYPGVVEHYLNLGDCYDARGLLPLRTEIMTATQSCRSPYRRAYHCLEAAGQLRWDSRDWLLTEALRLRLQKRAKGILSREIKKGGPQAGQVIHRFLSAITWKGRICLWNTVEAQAKRVYVLCDSFGLAHELLSPILSAATAAGWDVIACPDPMDPERLAHLILPGLSLAFVTSSPELPWPGKSHRRLRLDAMADSELYRTLRPRLRFSRKVSSALEGEAVEALAQAKAGHDYLEQLYHPHVDFGLVNQMASQLAQQLLAPSLTASPQ